MATRALRAAASSGPSLHASGSPRRFASSRYAASYTERPYFAPISDSGPKARLLVSASTRKGSLRSVSAATLRSRSVSRPRRVARAWVDSTWVLVGVVCWGDSRGIDPSQGYRLYRGVYIGIDYILLESPQQGYRPVVVDYQTLIRVIRILLIFGARCELPMISTISG